MIRKFFLASIIAIAFMVPTPRAQAALSLGNFIHVIVARMNQILESTPVRPNDKVGSSARNRDMQSEAQAAAHHKTRK